MVLAIKLKTQLRSSESKLGALPTATLPLLGALQGGRNGTDLTARGSVVSLFTDTKDSAEQALLSPLISVSFHYHQVNKCY